MVLGVRSALPPAHSRTEGKQKATTPAPPQVASPQCFQRREALGSFLYRPPASIQSPAAPHHFLFRDQKREGVTSKRNES